MVEFKPYLDIKSRSEKLISILLLGVLEVEFDEWGVSSKSPGKRFPRIHLQYLNNLRKTIMFEDDSFEYAQEIRTLIIDLLTKNLDYMAKEGNLYRYFEKD